MYWHKQTPDKPLFPGLVWSRPENRQSAGKLLIIGGNLHGFAAPAEAYTAATAAGVGSCRVLLPDALKKTVGHVFEAGEYAPSTPSGSFASRALDEWLAQAAWADGVLVAGDVGRNSETAILLEKFLDKYKGHATITKDAPEAILSSPQTIATRPQTCLVVSVSQLQRLCQALRTPRAITYTMPLVSLIETLHDLTTAHPISIMVAAHNLLIVAAEGKLSSTPVQINEENASWQVNTAGHAAVWWLQNPTKPFEALTCAAIANEL